MKKDSLYIAFAARGFANEITLVEAPDQATKQQWLADINNNPNAYTLPQGKANQIVGLAKKEGQYIGDSLPGIIYRPD
jgi:hypothetical protein